MMFKLLIILVYIINQQQNENTRFHELMFTASDPIISNRCITKVCLSENYDGFVKETYDNKNRCVKLDFFNNTGSGYQSAYFPCKIKYVWTDSSVIQTLHQSDEVLFSDKEFIRPNKVEYIFKDLKVVKSRSFWNNTLVEVTNHDNLKIEDADFFMMYSGCEMKYNSKYRMKF